MFPILFVCHHYKKTQTTRKKPGKSYSHCLLFHYVNFLFILLQSNHTKPHTLQPSYNYLGMDMLSKPPFITTTYTSKNTKTSSYTQGHGNAACGRTRWTEAPWRWAAPRPPSQAPSWGCSRRRRSPAPCRSAASPGSGCCRPQA